MSIKTIGVTITGTQPLLQNNPQTVDRFNPYARAMARINAKKTARTDEDYLELRDIELRSKLYFDDALGVYVPAKWVLEAVAKTSFKTAKIAKAEIRGAVFTVDEKLVLDYRDKHLVKTADDIVGNPKFRHMMALPQGQIRVMKAAPIFHDWSFSTELEFDDKILDPHALARVIEHAAKYGGFGDFRPTFGRATAKVKL